MKRGAQTSYSDMYSDPQQMERFLCSKNECSAYVKQARSFVR